MNKLRFLFILCVAVFVSSCKDDDGDDVGGTGNIVGTWAFESDDYMLTINDTDYIDYFLDYYADYLDTYTEEELEELIIEAYGIDSDVNADFSITFKKDSTYSSTNSDGTTSGTYTLTDDVLTFDVGTVNEGELNVYSLTKSELIIGYDETYQADANGDGVNDEIFSKYTITLEKQ